MLIQKARRVYIKYIPGKRNKKIILILPSVLNLQINMQIRNEISNSQIWCLLLPFLSGLQALKKLFSPPVRKFFSNVLTRHYRFLEYRSDRLNSPGGSMTKLDFKVRKLLGDIVVGMFASLRVSTVRGLEFTINSTSVIKDLRNWSFKDKL